MNDIGAPQQTRALTASTAAFTVCFAVWTLFSIIGLQIQRNLGLSETEFGLLVGAPILSGSLIRLGTGLWAGGYGGRRVFAVLMLMSAAAALPLSWATTYPALLAGGLALGVVGGVFPAGVAYVSRRYPPERQNLALGVFGMGSLGAAISVGAAPFVMDALGWPAVVRIWGAALVAVAAAYWVFTEDEPAAPGKTRQAPETYAKLLEPLKELRVWRFSLYYFFVFGTFIALAVWLPRYLVGAYGLEVRAAGLLGALFVLAGGLSRLPGVRLTEWFGARRVMYWSFLAAAVCAFLLSYPPTDMIVHGSKGDIALRLSMQPGLFIGILAVMGVFLAFGASAVNRHLPVHYPRDLGPVSGLVSMIGGLGGFFLPLTFGMLVDLTGLWSSAFMLLFALVTIALAWMHFAILRMERRLVPELVRVSPDLPELAAPVPLELTEWNPEDQAFWEAEGKRIASRNLWISIACLLLAFAVWMVWSVVVINLPNVGFRYSTNELFWLTALPGLSGATLRIFYSFMVPIFGGRRWTTISTASLLVPSLWIGFAVQNPETPYLLMLVLALLCGFGGGNFASSMANISFFFPQSRKGAALGLNAGLGNLGVSLVQFVVPLAIGAGVLGWLGGEPQTWVKDGVTKPVWLQNAGFVWVPFILAATAAAWFGMNDIASAKASFKDQAVIFRRKHNWLMCWLYTGTFGSFIGYSAGLPMLIKTLFPAVDPTRYAFLGPLVGALMRPVGGWIADRLGGARVTFWNFIVMAGAVFGVLHFMPSGGAGGNFYGFLAMFLVLFLSTGIGNGSVFRMIPVIFMTERRRAAEGGGAVALEQARRDAARESAAVLGFSSAVAAYGAFFIPKSYGTAIALTGSPDAALYAFLIFYATCVAMTWWYYSGKNAEMPC